MSGFLDGNNGQLKIKELHEDLSWKGVGSNPGDGKGLFLVKYQIK